MKYKHLTEKEFFKPARIWWGEYYYIPVRNSWNNKLEKRLIPANLKEVYQNELGNSILFDYQFDEWYINKKII